MNNPPKFTTEELIDIEKIKAMLLQGLSFHAIADRLGCHRQTVSNKIAKWMKTSDFDEWIDALWLKLSLELANNPETRLEVYRQLTRLKCVKQTRKINMQAHVDLSPQIQELIRFSRGYGEGRSG